MARDPVDDLLREWGQAQLGRHGGQEWERNRDRDPGSHPISKARQFEMTRKTYANTVAGRNGHDRRVMMAQASGIRGMRIIPAWAADPIVCKETRHVGPGMAAIDGGIPTHLKAIDRAAMELYRKDTLCGLCLRMEFTARGFQSDKAQQVAQALGISLTTRKYREELRRAKDWIRLRGVA